MQNTQNPTEDEIRALLPGYALGILEPDELLLVDDFLVKRPDLRDQIDSFDLVASQLAYDTQPVAPPVGSKEKILTRAQEDLGYATAGANVSHAQPTGPPAKVPRPISSVTGGRVRQPDRQRPRLQPSRAYRSSPTAAAEQSWHDQLGEWWRTALGWKMYALATTAALALLAVIFNQNQQMSEQNITQLATREAEIVELAQARDDAINQMNAILSDSETLRNQTADLEQANAQLVSQNGQLVEENVQLSETNEQLADDLTLRDEELELIRAELEEQRLEQELIFAAVQSAEQFVALNGTTSDEVTGSLVTSKEGSYIFLTGLEPLPPTQTYQLWLIPEGEAPVSSGLITLTSSAPTTIAVDLSLSAEGFAAVGLSIEPEGGSEQPTEDAIVLLGTRT